MTGLLFMLKYTVLLQKYCCNSTMGPRVPRLRVLGRRVLGARVPGLRVLGLRVLGLRVLGPRVLGLSARNDPLLHADGSAEFQAEI